MEGDKELGCVKAESGQGGATTARKVFQGHELWPKIESPIQCKHLKV